MCGKSTKRKSSAPAAENVQKDFTKAERIMALNGPMMQFCIYAGMVFVMSYGSYNRDHHPGPGPERGGRCPRC